MLIPRRFLTFVLIVIPVMAASESEWFYVQGDDGHTGHLKSASSPNQLVDDWMITPDDIVQRPMVIAQGRAIVLDNDWTLRGIDLASGTVVWQRDDIGSMNLIGHAAPLVTDGSLVFMLGDRQVEGSDGIMRWKEHVIALDVVDGSIAWAKNHNDLIEDHDWVSVSAFHGLTAGSGHVYLALRAQMEAFQSETRRVRLAALDPDTGSFEWANATDPITSTPTSTWPTRFTFNNGLLYYLSESRIFSIDTATGDRALVLELTDTGFTHFNSAISFNNDRLYFVAGDDRTSSSDAEFRLFAYNLQAQEISFQKPIGENGSADSFDAELLAVTSELSYLVTEDGTVWAYDAFNGSEIWQKTLPGDAVESGGPIIIGERLITATNHTDGTSTIHGLDAASGTLLWDLDLGDRIFSPSAYSNGTLIVGGDILRGLRDELIFTDRFQ